MENTDEISAFKHDVDFFGVSCNNERVWSIAFYHPQFNLNYHQNHPCPKTQQSELPDCQSTD